MAFDASAQQRPIGHDTTVNYDSLGQTFSRRLTKISTPAYERRRQPLKELQRRGYANVLMDVVTFDAKFSTLVWIILRGAQDGTSMQVPFSVAALVHPRDDFPAIALLNSLNIFTLWYVVVVIVGVSVLTGFRPAKAFLVVFCVWSVSVLFNVAVLTFMRDGLHLVV